MTQHLLEDEKPSVYISELSAEPVFKEHPLRMLYLLKTTEQSKKHHPEGSVWNHTMMVLDEAAKVREQSKDPTAFMWAALLHDIGKPSTTKIRRGRITSYDHDKVGEMLSIEFLRVFTEEEEFILKVGAFVRYHMHMLYVLKELPYGDMQGLLQRVDIYDMALLCRCDRFGRTGADTKEEEEQYSVFLERLEKLSVQNHKIIK